MPDNVRYLTKKKDIQDVQTYLRNANTKDFAPAAWATGSRWCFGHGEGRSTSKETYHIDFKKQSDGHHITCIFIDVHGTQQKVTAGGETTGKDWGAEAPSPAEVLLFYKKPWGVEDSDDEEDRE
ncbi:hypothetical protein FBULB1_1326 [Fusarium bulbicola]|nr:hypothetical protein FBULB1_1326 [Fusarium bulbicola]